ncbi:putative methyltransferase-domain-containing protein [Cladorrhinum sp. PSN259]|nr:putative methyltransferase-domain-containing protein [Cladorrhinum sp. PSN259]
MHYIKLLRPPVVERVRSEQILKIVLAITTDLGDSYLSPKEAIDLLVIGAYTAQKDGQDQLVPVNLTQRSVPKWRTGMRVLKIDLPLPPHPITTIQVRPLNRQLTALGTTDIYPPTGQGLIMAAFSDIGQTSPVCFRSLRLPTPDNQTFQVEEDMGDSIARHIWDSGIATTSLIADMLLTSSNNDNTPMQSFRSLLQSRTPLKILEIGCGIGTLGIAMARILGHQASNLPTPQILMTDLPEAEERARANIARQPDTAIPSSLDFESLDWEQGKLGIFREKVQSQKWDLVIVSDCTYNTDTLLSLVQTLSAVHRHSSSSEEKEGGKKGPKIFLATKSRHSSERQFFDLMVGDGWTIEEEAEVDLPHIDGGGMPIEVYLFEKT